MSVCSEQFICRCVQGRPETAGCQALDLGRSVSARLDSLGCRWRQVNFRVEHFYECTPWWLQPSVWFPWKVWNWAEQLKGKKKKGFSSMIFSHICRLFLFSLLTLGTGWCTSTVLQAASVFLVFITWRNEWWKFKLLELLLEKCLVQIDFQLLL